MFECADKVTKMPLQVRIALDDGSVLDGVLYVTPQGRLSDLLNGEREFLPFETADGSFLVLKKSSFRSVQPVELDNKASQAAA